MHVYGPVGRKQLIIQQFHFHDSKLVQKSAIGKAVIKFSDIQKIIQKDNYILLYLAKDNFLYVSNDAFLCVEDRKEVLRRLSAKV